VKPLSHSEETALPGEGPVRILSRDSDDRDLAPQSRPARIGDHQVASHAKTNSGGGVFREMRRFRELVLPIKFAKERADQHKMQGGIVEHSGS